VGQGLTLPAVIRWLGLAHAGRREHGADRIAEFTARQRAVERVIEKLDEIATARDLPEEMVRSLREYHSDRLQQARHRGEGGAANNKLVALDEEIEALLLETEREAINDFYRRGELKDEARRRIERELDLRDAHNANLRTGE